MIENEIIYIGDKKPSVDTPIQSFLYNNYKCINFLIHGHAYIEGAIFTDSYYPCGDIREFLELKQFISFHSTTFKINLKNHGFIIGSDTIENLETLINNSLFKYRELPEQL